MQSCEAPLMPMSTMSNRYPQIRGSALAESLLRSAAMFDDGISSWKEPDCRYGAVRLAGCDYSIGRASLGKEEVLVLLCFPVKRACF